MDLYLKIILQKNRPISAKNKMTRLEKVFVHKFAQKKG